MEIRIHNILFAFVLFALIAIEVKSEETLRHHVIIAIDCRPGGEWIFEKEPRDMILNLIGSPVNGIKGRRLYENGDYISACTYGTNDFYDSVDKMVGSFIHPFNAIGRFVQITPQELRRRLTIQWDAFVQSPNLSGEASSLTSLVKPFVLKALNSDTALVGRTFLILVSDKKPNGATLDIDVELRNYMQHYNPKADGRTIDLYCDEVFNACDEVMHTFRDRPIRCYSVRNGRPSYINPLGYVQLFEIVPMQGSFYLTSVIMFPPRITALRSISGGYKIRIPIRWLNNPSYRFLRMEAFLQSAEGDTLLSKQCLLNLSDTIVEWHVPSNVFPNHVQLKAWLRLYDGFYNATMMSPERHALAESGRDGLITAVDIEYESAATVLGLPLPTWLWKLLATIDDSFLNQHRAAFAAQVILCTIVGAILLLLLIVFARWLTKPRYYTPTHIEW